MQKKAVVFALALLVAAVALAQSSGYTKIGAQFMITGKDLVDPPPGQKKDRLALFLTGDGAKAIYDALPTAPVGGGACEEGLELKRSGGLICANHGGRSYSCSVAILLKSGETRPLGSC
jgi:hypothetical protein